MKKLCEIDTWGFAQLGSPGYKAKAFLEIQRIIEISKKLRTKQPLNTQFMITENQHDFGLYYGLGLFALQNYQHDDDKLWNFVNAVEAIDGDEHFEYLDGIYNSLTESLTDDLFELSNSLKMDYDKAVAMRYANDLDAMYIASYDGVAMTLCPLGCQVEPDGRCEHGYDSILIVNGLI